MARDLHVSSLKQCLRERECRINTIRPLQKRPVYLFLTQGDLSGGGSGPTTALLVNLPVAGTSLLEGTAREGQRLPDLVWPLSIYMVQHEWSV
jgi:hypothetical protein